MGNEAPLPPGQRWRDDFHRFGLGKFANRFPTQIDHIDFDVRGDIATPLRVSAQFNALARREMTSDFHCVTTWSYKGLRWEGVRFCDFFHQIVVPAALPADDIKWVIFRGQDGYACAMLLSDLLAEDVLLADSLNGAKLGIDHGAPLRLVAPAHYGYKNVKHIRTIEFRRTRKGYRFPWPYPQFMDHPRGRVAQEERAIGLPNWLIRPIYRALIKSAASKSARALARRLAQRP